MARTPSVLDQITAATESNNRDYDKGGRPVTSPKGARFAMQVMPETARDPGFGLRPADPNNAEDMNRLGREYRAKMESRYGGDLSKMWAAYNAGPGAVDSALKKHGANWLKHMPAETRDYVRKNMSAAGGKQVATSSAGGGTQNFLADLESSLAPEVAASSRVSSNADKIFNSDARLDQEAAAVRSQNERQTTALGVLEQAQAAAHAAQVGSKIRTIEDTRAISEQVQSAIGEMRQATQPVFEARQRVANQLDEVAVMNPLVRGIKGIFDLNYDQKHLEGQLKAFDTTLAMRMNDFEYVNKLNSVALGEIERRYSLDTAMSGLLQEQAKEDLTLVGLQLANTQNFLQLSKDEISTQASVIAAKATAQNDMLGRLDLPTITGLMNQAASNGGKVMHGEVELDYAALREVAQKKEQQALAIEGYRMGVAAQRMDFAEKSADNIMQYATREQLEGWINAGGVATLPDGTTIQLPQDKLTHYLGTHISRENAMAEDIANTIPGKQALQIASSTVESSIQYWHRGKAFAPAGSQDDKYLDQVFKAQAGLVNQLREAVKTGKPAAVQTALTQKIAQAAQQARQVMDGAILKSVGGDKQAAQYISTWVSGAQLSDADSASALTHFALKGGLPNQLQASPEAKQIFQQALKIVEENRIVDGKPRSAAQLRQIVTDQVLTKARQTVGQARFDRMENSLPFLARQDGNALGRLRDEDWARIRLEAKRQAATALASKIKTTPEAVMKMEQTGKPLSSAQRDIDLYGAFSSNADSFNAMEQMTIVDELDSMPALSPGIANSQLLIDYIRSQKLSQRAGNFTAIANNSSFGDFLMSPVTNNALEQNIGEYAGILDNAQNAFYADQRNRAKQFDSAYAKSPVARSYMILSSIEGVGKAGADALRPVIERHLNSNPKLAMATGAAAAAAPLRTRSMVQAQESAVLQFLQQSKFEDPAVEGYRKKAVSNWQQAATESGSWTERFLDAIKAGAPGLSIPLIGN